MTPRTARLDRGGPGELAARLAALPVEVESYGVNVSEIAVASYPGGTRSSALVAAISSARPFANMMCSISASTAGFLMPA